jgi:hypothetical protein
MRLGSRRILWGCNCLLLVAIAMVFRPLRSWIDQTIIARSISPNLSVQEIHLHPNRLEQGVSVVEAKQFNWSAVHGTRRFGISAEQAWLVIDNATLIDRNLQIPKALLQHSRLYLETLSPSYSVAASGTSGAESKSKSVWQQQLHGRFGELEWNDLKQQFDGVLKLDQFSAQFKSKIDSWVSGSERIAMEARQLGDTANLPSNPLRDDAQLVSRISQLDGLVAREAKLREDFAKLDGSVQAKLTEIGTEFERHVALAKDQAQLIKSKNREQLIDYVLTQAGQRVFTQFQPYAEIADLLCRSAAAKTSYTANEDYQLPGREILSIDNLSATGLFLELDRRSAFCLQSQCQRTTAEPFGSVARNRFHYQFDSQNFLVKIAANSRAHHAEAVDLQIEISPLTKPSVDLTLDKQPEIQLSAAQWVISSNGHGIEGELLIDAHLMPFVLEQHASLSQFLTQQRQQAEKSGDLGQELVVTLSGSWRAPNWQADPNTIPGWLEKAVQEQLDQHHQAQEYEMIARLEGHVANEIDRLASQLNQQLDAAVQLTGGHTQTIAAIRTELINQMKLEARTEFARSPEEGVNR